MTLRGPTLDNRNAQQLVDELKSRATELFPEWTDHNVSDPGVALLELVASVAAQTNWRLNQVPDRLFGHFLELVGVERLPAVSALAEISFRATVRDREELVIPEGTEVSTVASEGEEPLVFSTHRELRVTQPSLEAVLAVNMDGMKPMRSKDLTRFVQAPEGSENIFPRTTPDTEPDARPQAGDALMFGFADPIASHIIDIDITTRTDGHGIDPTDPPLVWEWWAPTKQDPDESDWLPLDVDDTTGGFNRDGTITLYIPDYPDILDDGLDLQLTIDDKKGFWVRCRYLNRDEGYEYNATPDVSTISVHLVGGLVLARNATFIPSERIGVSDGQPGQEFKLAHQELLDPGAAEVRVVANGEEELYKRVDSFAESGPEDAHVTWDLADGIIRFGPRIRSGRVASPAPPAQSVTHHQRGAIPPWGATVTFDGATVWESNGAPGQTFTRPDNMQVGLGSPPLQLRRNPSDGEATWRYDWVDDFSASGPDDLHVRWNPELGRVEFGPRTTQSRSRPNPADATRAFHQHGKVPPKDAEIVAPRYRIGGGTRGNVGPGEIRVLRSSLPYVAAVENRRGAEHGVGFESIEDAKSRGPIWLRTGGRAVTAADYIRLVKEAAQLVEDVQCLPRSKVRKLDAQLANAGTPEAIATTSADQNTACLFVVVNAEHLTRPTKADLELNPYVRRRINDYLEPRRMVGTTIEIGIPRYVTFSPILVLEAESGLDPQTVAADVETALYEKFHPNGRTDFDMDVHAASLVRLASEVRGVSAVRNAEMLLTDGEGTRQGDRVKQITVLEHCIPLIDRPSIHVSTNKRKKWS